MELEREKELERELRERETELRERETELRERETETETKRVRQRESSSWVQEKE